MVRDVFIEEIVKKKKEPLDWLKIIAILVLCLALAVGFLFCQAVDAYFRPSG